MKYRYFLKDTIIIVDDISMIPEGIEYEEFTPINYDLEIKEQKINDLKKECYNELSLTDWYFVRKIDIGIEVPKKIIEQRNEIRKKYNDLIFKI